MQAIAYGNVYVAQVAMGANPQQTLQAFREAETYEGTSLILAYSHCIAHGFDLRYGMQQQDKAVASGYWPLLRYDPAMRDIGEAPFRLDSPRPTLPFKDYAYNELRYRALAASRPAEADALLNQAQRAVLEKYFTYEEFAQMNEDTHGLGLMPATAADYRELARRRLPRHLFDYMDGAAYDEITAGENIAALHRLRLRQRVLCDVSAPKLATTVLGQPLAMPLALAPIGIAGAFARRAEVQAARAAEAAGIPFCESTVSICSIEEVRAATRAPFWYQLYVMRDRGYARELMVRAAAAGCPVLVLTVDLAVMGARYRDVRNGMAGVSGLGGRLRQAGDLLAHPCWLLDVAVKGKPLVFGNLTSAVPDARSLPEFKAWVDSQFDPAVTWRDIDWVRENWPGKVVLKGKEHALDLVDAMVAAADDTMTDEEVAERPYRPAACRTTYRLVIVRKNLQVSEPRQGALFEDYRYFLYLTNDWESTPEQIVYSANQRCQQENVLAQLKEVRALHAPVDNLLSNEAYMVMTSLAWNLKAWLALSLPEASAPRPSAVLALPIPSPVVSPPLASAWRPAAILELPVPLPSASNPVAMLALPVPLALESAPVAVLALLAPLALAPTPSLLRSPPIAVLTLSSPLALAMNP